MLRKMGGLVQRRRTLEKIFQEGPSQKRVDQILRGVITLDESV